MTLMTEHSESTEQFHGSHHNIFDTADDHNQKVYSEYNKAITRRKKQKASNEPHGGGGGGGNPEHVPREEDTSMRNFFKNTTSNGISQIVTFLTSAVTTAIASIWPSDLLVLLVIFMAEIIWFALVTMVNKIVHRHANKTWVRLWVHGVTLMSNILVAIGAAYATRMLTVLFVSASATIAQSAIVTIAALFIVLYLWEMVGDEYMKSRRDHILHLMTRLALMHSVSKKLTRRRDVV